MASPNKQLEAALAQFANQSGVTLDQVAQLRAAITSDAKQLQEMNQKAQAGQLRSFALQSAENGSPNLIGTYDIQSATVTLPGSSFQPAGSLANRDLIATVRLQQILIEFSHKAYMDAESNSHPVTQNMVDNLQSTINQSSVLAEQIKKAATTIDEGDRYRRAYLEHFDLIAPGFAAGGTYTGGDKTMRLPPFDLQTKAPMTSQGRFDPDDMTFVLGHEIQHSFNYPAKLLAAKAFQENSILVAKSAGQVHDYTAPISNYIQAGREDEAKAEISGWNALLSRQKKIQPHAPELDLMLGVRNDRVADFIEQDPAATSTKARPLSGLAFNHDGTLSMSAANVAAMGQHYFDKVDHAHAQPGQRSLGIGEKGTSDYPNYYGTAAVEMVIGVERRFALPTGGLMPRMTINMAGVRISEELLEKEGINLGADKTPQPYYDSSQAPATLHHFDHTQDGSVVPAQDHQYVPVSPSLLHLREDPHPPEDFLLEKLRAGVRELDRKVGKPWDEQSERLSASALTMAVEKGFGVSDDVWVGLNQKTERYAAGELLLIQRIGGGASPDPFRNRAQMSTAEALSQPAEQRYRQVDALRQTQTEGHQQQEALVRSQPQSVQPHL